MLPAIRSLQALPDPAKQAMTSFLELVEGVPITEEVKRQLAAQPHTIVTPQWELHHRKTLPRSVRTARGRVRCTNQIVVFAHCPNYVLPPMAANWDEAVRRTWQFRTMLEWDGSDEDIVDGMLRAKKIIARIEAGELCSGCNFRLAMPRARFCQRCGFEEYFKPKPSI